MSHANAIGVRAAAMHTFSMAADAGIGLLSLEPNELGRKRTEELQTNLYTRTGATHV